MKTYLGCAVLILGLSACSSASASTVGADDTGPVESQSEPLVQNALTPEEEATALRLIDEICADTWCAGDYNYVFQRLTCSREAGTCTLSMELFPRAGVPSPRSSYSRFCKTEGFTGFESLVATTQEGFQSLQSHYFDALTECMSLIESRLPAGPAL